MKPKLTARWNNKAPNGLTGSYTEICEMFGTDVKSNEFLGTDVENLEYAEVKWK